MNNVALMGRLTGDPDVRHNGEKAVARYTLAVDRRGKDKGADFIRCVAFDNGADFADRYLNKGTKIAVAGSIHTDSYTNRDGQKVYTTEVIVREHYFCEPREGLERRNNLSYDGQRENARANTRDGFTDALDDLKGVPFA